MMRKCTEIFFIAKLWDLQGLQIGNDFVYKNVSMSTLYRAPADQTFRSHVAKWLSEVLSSQRPGFETSAWLT
jgi:hypothetical protein